MRKKNKLNLRNPVAGATAIGLGLPLATTIGAVVRHNDIHAEAMTTLVGGVISGAIAGTFGCCVPEADKNSSCCLQFSVAVLSKALVTAAALTAPLIGEKCLNLGITWGQTVIDGLIGDAILLGGVLAVGATCTGVLYGCDQFFSKPRIAETNQQSSPALALDVKV